MRVTAVPGLVQQLLAHEAGQSEDEQALAEAAYRACEKLRIYLTPRIGRDGFRTLIVRALHLTTPRFPHLRAVRIAADGTLEVLGVAARHPEDPARTKQQETPDGAVALVTHLIELLVTFIGDDLTWHMLSTIWPLQAPVVGNDTAGTILERKGDSPGGEEETA
jgi:hypothetical protein